MPTLLQLPEELRLRIYQHALTADFPQATIPDSYHIHRGLRAAQAIQNVDHHLRHDIGPLFWSSNMFTTYTAVDGSSPHVGRDYLNWLVGEVAEAAKHLRHLEFVVTARCERRKLALGNPKEPGFWYRTDAPSCTTTITVNLARPADGELIIDEEEGCSHHAAITDRFRGVLSQISWSSRQPRVTKEILWDLFESCSVLSNRYSGYWPYEQAVKMYAGPDNARKHQEMLAEEFRRLSGRR